MRTSMSPTLTEPSVTSLEPADEVDQAAFAGARSADDAMVSPDLMCRSISCRAYLPGTVLVGEVDVLEVDVAVGDFVYGVLGVVQIRLFMQHFAYTADAGRDMLIITMTMLSIIRLMSRLIM